MYPHPWLSKDRVVVIHSSTNGASRISGLICYTVTPPLFSLICIGFPFITGRFYHLTFCMVLQCPQSCYLPAIIPRYSMHRGGIASIFFFFLDPPRKTSNSFTSVASKILNILFSTGSHPSRLYLVPEK